MTAAAKSRFRTSRLRPPWRAATPADLAKWRVQASLLVVLVLLAAALAAGVLSTVSLYRSAESRYVRVVLPLRTAVRDLELGMVEEESGMRAYMITTDRRSLRPYFAGRGRVDADVAEIVRLAPAQPRVTDAIASLRREIVGLQGYYDRLITFVADGSLGRRRARAEVFANERAFARFERTAARLESDIDAFVRQTRAGERSTLYRAVGTLVVVGFLGLAIAGTLLVSVPHRLRRLYLAEEDARRRAEQGANAARALAHVSDAVVLVDEGGRVRSWNPAAERQFRVDTGLALGRRAEDVVPAYARLVEGGDGIVPVEVGGEERWYAATTSSFEGGRVLTVRDVTAAHALEQARTDFVATASHELRTPLTSIYGAARTLLGRDDLPEERRVELLRIVERESEQLAQIVDQLLVSARLSRGTVTAVPGPCDVREVCEEVLAAAGARKPERTTLALAAPDRVRELRCDAALLRQVLGNLVDNALKYSPDGGRVEVRIADEPALVRVEVADEGLGIAASEQERIFERFYRVDAAMARGVGGSGLGLHIARELVERMGGTLSVESAPGEGSTFAVTLPRRLDT